MIRTFEALFAAILVVSFMAYLTTFPHFSDNGLHYQQINLDKVRYCELSNKGYSTKLLVIKFNESFSHACVNITIPANYTLAYENNHLIPSMGGSNITLQIENYNGSPILIYTSAHSGDDKFKCAYPFKNINYTVVFEKSNYKLQCSGVK